MTDPKPAIVLDYFVNGTPVPQGSKKAWYNEKSKRVMMTEDAGVRHSTWRHEVTGHSRQAMSDVGRFEPLREPISVALTFDFHRPQIHYGSGKNSEKVKASAPPHPIKPPDVDKLTRAVFDSLTSIVWVDDSQVVAALVRKRWVERWEPEGVHIKVGAFRSQEEDLGIEP
jgi:crossover junction endodeoxyribonuclease RusA